MLVRLALLNPVDFLALTLVLAPTPHRLASLVSPYLAESRGLLLTLGLMFPDTHPLAPGPAPGVPTVASGHVRNRASVCGVSWMQWGAAHNVTSFPQLTAQV